MDYQRGNPCLAPDAGLPALCGIQLSCLGVVMDELGELWIGYIDASHSLPYRIFLLDHHSPLFFSLFLYIKILFSGVKVIRFL
jgi:hypothetical protein